MDTDDDDKMDGCDEETKKTEELWKSLGIKSLSQVVMSNG